MSGSDKQWIEVGFERALFASRWVLAPIFLGLAIMLAVLTVVFLRQLAVYVPQALSLSADDAILAALTLIDVTLVANLLVVVLFSGYENFVSRFDIRAEADRPVWMGKVDFSDLKMKLIASIVAISGIQLLKRFMEIGGREPIDDQVMRELFWLTAIHLIFVVAGVLMALMDRLIHPGGREPEHIAKD